MTDHQFIGMLKLWFFGGAILGGIVLLLIGAWFFAIWGASKGWWEVKK